MSIKRGNDFARNNDYVSALKEYKKISKGNPLYSQARFNIEYIEKLGLIDTKDEPEPTEFLYKNFEGKPILSIVMPVFNVAPFLDASILSVLSQTIKDFELIIVNDASTDNGKKIIEMYEQLDSRIKVINLDFNTLGGAGIPSNIGIKAAKGKYLGFVDSDDWVMPDAFEKMVRKAEEFNAEIVIGDFKTFEEDTREVKESYDKKNWEGIPLNKIVSAQNCQQLYRISPVPWRKLYKTEFLFSNKIEYPEGDYFYEDNPLHWFVLNKAEKIVVIDTVISFHRMAREGQTMSSATYKLAAISCHMNTIANYLIKNNLSDQIRFDEFYDYCYRTDWIATRQQDVDTKNIIKKVFSKIYEKTSNVCPPKNVRPNFIKKFSEFKTSYPDLDLTIVIPVYNCEDLIESTLESVLKISEIKYNIIIIDDGSTDNTINICRKYSDKFQNIHFYQQANKGAGRARNAVIPLCTGDYTYFLDADDIINSDNLVSALKNAKQAKNDLYFVKYEIEFFEESKKRGMFNADAKLWDEFEKVKSNEELKLLSSGLINYPWNRIIKTALLHDENIFFGSTVVHNDIPYHWHSITAANNIGFGQEVVCTHRKFTERSQITNINDARRLMVFEALRSTNESISRYSNFTDLKTVWNTFAKDLIVWAKDRVPETHLDKYEELKKDLLNNQLVN